MSTQMVRMGYQYPACRFSDVLIAVRSKKSLLRSTLRSGRLSITPELEPGFTDETEAVDEEEDMLTMQSGSGVLDFVKSGLSLAKEVGIRSVKRGILKSIPGAEGVVDAIEFAADTAFSPGIAKASNILSEKLNQNPSWRPGFAGEKHILLPTKFGVTRANYAGPGTNLQARLDRGDIGVDGPNGIDLASRTHDILYSIAKNKDDIRAADNRLIADIQKSSQGSKTKKAAIAMLKAKLFGENIGLFGPETFTELPSLRSGGRGLHTAGGNILHTSVKRSNTGEVGLSNSLTGSISGLVSGSGIGGPSTVALGNRSVMNFRPSSEFVKVSTGMLHGNYLNPYDDELQRGGSDHISFNPSGGGSGLGTVDDIQNRSQQVEHLVEKLVQDLPAIPSARLREDLQRGLKLAERHVQPVVRFGSKKFKKLQRELLGSTNVQLVGFRSQKQRGGQFGLLAGLAASFIVPEIIKLIKGKRGKGMHGSGSHLVSKKLERNKDRVLISDILMKVLRSHPPASLQSRGNKGKFVLNRQRGGQFGLLAGLAASFIVPEILKLIKGKANRSRSSSGKGMAGEGLGIGSLLSILGPSLSKFVLPAIIKEVKRIF